MSIITAFSIIAALGTVCYLYGNSIVLETAWQLPACFAVLFLCSTAVYAVGMYILTLFIGFEPKKERNRFYSLSCVHICQIIAFFANVSVKKVNEELFPKDSGFLIVANHQSMFDPLSMIANFSEHNIIYISKPENFKIPLVGKIAAQAGYLSIDRDNNREAMKTILKAIDYLKRGVYNVAIFPEGTRSKDGKLLPFHAGSFKIAQKAAVPIVVCCCKGTELVRKRAPFRHTKVELKLLEVIPAEKVVEMSTNDLADYSRMLIAKELGQE